VNQYFKLLISNQNFFAISGERLALKHNILKNAKLIPTYIEKAVRAWRVTTKI